MGHRVAILCVGPNDISQKTRRLLLEAEGYEVTTSTLEDVSLLLIRRMFDVAIIAYDVAENAEQKIRLEAVPGPDVVRLPEFIHPADLLKLIRKRTDPAAR